MRAYLIRLLLNTAAAASSACACALFCATQRLVRDAARLRLAGIADGAVRDHATEEDEDGDGLPPSPRHHPRCWRPSGSASGGRVLSARDGDAEQLPMSSRCGGRLR